MPAKFLFNNKNVRVFQVVELGGVQTLIVLAKNESLSPVIQVWKAYPPPPTPPPQTWLSLTATYPCTSY